MGTTFWDTSSSFTILSTNYPLASTTSLSFLKSSSTTDDISRSMVCFPPRVVNVMHYPSFLGFWIVFQGRVPNWRGFTVVDN